MLLNGLLLLAHSFHELLVIPFYHSDTGLSRLCAMRDSHKRSKLTTSSPPSRST